MYTAVDFQYALENTSVIYEPDRRIDTFGATVFEFHLITELMDSVNQVRVRNGRIEANRPVILRPDPSQEFQFEGFGQQADDFARWLRENMDHIAFLKYGFHFRRNDITEEVIHDPFEDVCARIAEQERKRGNPLSAVIQGVDEAWEICLLKFTVEMIAKSHGMNLFDFKRRGLL